MSRMELFVNTHVFHASLRFGTSVLADEKDKKTFLDFALQSQEEADLIYLSFTILDDEAHFLVALQKGKTAARKTMQTIMKNYRNFLKKEYCPKNDNDFLKIEWEAVETEEMLLESCKKIHLLSVERGYVKRARDYWWSSFQSYRGTYQWKGLDVRPILGYFAPEGNCGRNMFLKYHHRTSEEDGNPKRF